MSDKVQEEITTASYAVYVDDDNGWLDGCPDHCGVFFGRIPESGRYVSAFDGSEFGGHAEFSEKDEAEAFAEHLNESGDWVSRHTGEEERPHYEVAVVAS